MSAAKTCASWGILTAESWPAHRLIGPPIMPRRVALGGLFAHKPFGIHTAILVNGKVQHVTKRGDMPGARRPQLRGRALTVRPSTICASDTPPGSDSGATYLCATYSVGLGYANWAASAYPSDNVGQHLTVFPSGQPVPASTLNFGTSEYAIANGTLVRLGSSGSVSSMSAR